MKTLHSRYRWISTAAFCAASPLLAAANGDGCHSGGLINVGSGNSTSDGGSVDSGGLPATDAAKDGEACAQADCSGLPVLDDAKICSDGSSVGRSVCARSPYDGRCQWDFPACPLLDSADACVCFGPAPSAPSGVCPDGSPFGPTCVVNTAPPIVGGTSTPPITCSWSVRPCPAGQSEAGGTTCDERKATALAEAQSAVDANLGCRVDADCTEINFQSGCFDACTRVVNLAGAAAVKSAIDRVNANGCSRYVSDGCTLIAPPCAPPSTSPSCVGGRCI